MKKKFYVIYLVILCFTVSRITKTSEELRPIDNLLEFCIGKKDVKNLNLKDLQALDEVYEYSMKDARPLVDYYEMISMFINECNSEFFQKVSQIYKQAGMVDKFIERIVLEAESYENEAKKIVNKKDLHLEDFSLINQFYDEAIKLYKKANKLDKVKDISHKIAETRTRMETSPIIMKESLEIKIQMAKGAKNQAINCENQKNFDCANRYYKEANKIYHQLKMVKEEKEMLKKAAEMKPLAVKDFLEKAKNYEKENNLSCAAKFYQKAEDFIKVTEIKNKAFTEIDYDDGRKIVTCDFNQDICNLDYKFDVDKVFGLGFLGQDRDDTFKCKIVDKKGFEATGTALYPGGSSCSGYIFIKRTTNAPGYLKVNCPYNDSKKIITVNFLN